MGAYAEDAVCGTWVHSHEEDTDTEMVFRPSSYAFPPSRGRTCLELRRGGSYVEQAPGPVDVPEEVAGTWSLEGDRLLLHADGDRPGHAWEIVAAEPGRLTVRR